LEGLWLDLLFLGVNGISVNGGLTTPNLAEAEINARLVERARRLVVVADHSKLGRTAFGRIAQLERADLLITSSEADQEQLELLKRRGLKIQLA
jgi:DeoR family transcriptional regulator of aga operon